MFNEETAIIVIAAGAAIALLGELWLIVRGFRVSALWGFVAAIPGLNLLFVYRYFRRAWLPLLLILTGVAIAATPIVATRFFSVKIDLGERDKLVDGERHVTLTGWDRTDYSLVASMTDVVVLRMGNPDVTDAALENISELKQLRELNLNDSQITDAAVDRIQKLPNLEAVRVARTKLTPAGIEKLLTLPKLKNIDVTGLNVPAKLLRNWKNANPQTREYLN